MQKPSKEDLKWLRSKLQYGDVRKIAKICGYTSHSVSKFLGGRLYRAEMLDATMKLIEGRKNVLEKFERFKEVLRDNTPP